jgi:hypothetical protein
MHPTTAFPTTVDESGLGVREAIAADERPEPIEIAETTESDRSVPAAERPNPDCDDASADAAASIAGSSTISVAIPAYNEAETIAEVVVETREYADEVVVIDDGSADDTAARACDAGATVIEHDHNEGYGAALRTAFETADRRGVDHLVVLDGDGQHDPTDIPPTGGPPGRNGRRDRDRQPLRRRIRECHPVSPPVRYPGHQRTY